MKKTGTILKDNWDNAIELKIDEEKDIILTAVNSSFIFRNHEDLDLFVKAVIELLTLADKNDKR